MDIQSFYNQLFQTELISNALMLENFKTHQTTEQTNEGNMKNFCWHCNIKMSHVDMTLMSKHLAKLLEVMVQPLQLFVAELQVSAFLSEHWDHSCSLWSGLRSGGSIGCNFCQRCGGQRICVARACRSPRETCNQNINQRWY